jgi:zinc protease
MVGGGLAWGQEKGATAGGAAKLPTIAFEQYTMKNGLQVILSEDHTLPLVSVNIWYHVGPANEKAGRTGFAHLFEHMMFEGSQHVGAKAHFAYLEAAGATDINGTTNFDRTNYYETIPSNQLELALWLESDRMGYLLGTLDIEKLANQRDVVRNERRQSGENAPYGLVEEEVIHQLFPKTHPYYPAVIGSHADIEAARLDDVRNFFKQYYTPNNATLAIVGDFDKSKIRGLLEKYFGSIPKGPEVPKITVVTPTITAERRAVVTDQVELSRVYFAWIAPPVFKPGDAEAGLFGEILAGGKSSRLYRKLVYEKQIAQDVGIDAEEAALGTIFTLRMTAKPGVKPQDLEKAADEELNALRKTGPTAAELERARNVIESERIHGLERTNGVANRLQYYNQFLGTPRYFDKDLERYEKASTADVQRAAQEIFSTKARVVVYGVPGKKIISNVPKTSAEEDKKEALSAGSGGGAPDEPWRKTLPEPGPTPKFSVPPPTRFQLPNGLSVMLTERHNLPIVSVSFYSVGGSATNPLDRPGLAGFTATMLTEGTEGRSSLKFAQDSEQIGTTIDSDSGYDSSALNFSVLTRNSAAGFDLLSDAVLHPAFDEKEIERTRQHRITAVLQENDDPFALALRTVSQVLYPGSPYGFTALGTEASLKSISREELRGAWKRSYSPANSVLAVAGDISEAELRKLAGKYFSTWSGGAASAETIPATPAAPARSISIVDKPGAPQTALVIASLGAARSTPDYVPLEVLNTAFGGLFSSRVNMNLREEHGYTYGAQSSFLYRRGVGPFFAGGAVRTDATGPATKELFYELTRIREAEITPEELKKSRDSFSKSLIGLFETTESTALTTGQMFVFGLPNDYYRNLPEKIDGISAGDVLRVAKKYLSPGNTVVVAVGDRAVIEPELKKLDLGPVQVAQ